MLALSLGTHFVPTLQGRHIEKLTRRGKYLLFTLSQNWG